MKLGSCWGSLRGLVRDNFSFAQIKDLTYVCSVGWILGLTSAREKRYEEANAWLQVSMEAGVSVPPRFWAAAILTRWSVERCVLAEVARKGIY